MAASISSQDAVFSVSGLVKNDQTKAPLDNAQLIVIQDGKKKESISANAGKYSVDLPLGYKYSFIFYAWGFVQKIIVVDTRNIPAEEVSSGFELTLDIGLTSYVKGYNKKLNKIPIGKAAYDPKINP